MYTSQIQDTQGLSLCKMNVSPAIIYTQHNLAVMKTVNYEWDSKDLTDNFAKSELVSL